MQFLIYDEKEQAQDMISFHPPREVTPTEFMETLQKVFDEIDTEKFQAALTALQNRISVFSNRRLFKIID